jgi:hypothetical protein
MFNIIGLFILRLFIALRADRESDKIINFLFDEYGIFSSARRIAVHSAVKIEAAWGSSFVTYYF